MNENDIIKATIEEVVNTISNNKGKYIKQVYSRTYGTQAYITLDALDKEDYPNGIRENTIYVQFNVDFIGRKMEITSCGSTWISDIDKERHPEYRYLAMHSIYLIAKKRKVKGLRKTTFKNAQDIAAKMLNTFNGIMDEVNDYTGGYPYKNGIKDICKD